MAVVVTKHMQLAFAGLFFLLSFSGGIYSHCVNIFTPKMQDKSGFQGTLLKYFVFKPVEADTFIMVYDSAC